MSVGFLLGVRKCSGIRGDSAIHNFVNLIKINKFSGAF